MAHIKYKIFVINLDRDVSRWCAMRAQLEKLGLPYERFPAVDGREISDEVLRRHYSAELNRRKYYVDLSRSEIACYISHLKVCEKILSENLDYAIILEDDIILKDSFALVPYALDSIANWNYIKLIAPFKRKKIVSSKPIVFEIPATCDIENWISDNPPNAPKITKSSKSITVPIAFELVRWEKSPTGTQAYAITKDGAKEFLKKRSRFFRPIDVDLQYNTLETKLDTQGLLPSCCELANISSGISRKKRYHYPFARLVYKFRYELCFFADLF